MIGLVIAGALASLLADRASAAVAVAVVISEDGEQSPTSPPDAATKVVFANTKTFLQGWTEYDTGTCALIDTGKHTALTAPKFGTLAYATKSFPLGPGAGSCAGTVLPFSVVYYTWTDTKTTNSKDLFKLEWKTADGQFTQDRDWTIVLGPRIYFNGRDVTNTTQKVAIGQKIALTTATTEAGQTQSWTVSAKTVGGYTRGSKAEVKPTDFTKSSTTFFWTTLGTKNVTYTLTRKNGQTGTAKATFEAQGPTGANVTTKLGNVQIIANSRLSFGNIQTAAAPGITFTETAGASPKPGHFVWAQLVDFDTFLEYLSAGGKLTCSFGAGLDNTFPYDTGASTNDSPGSGLQAIWNKAYQQNRFRMFLMWQSSTSGSIPVPLGYVSWSWSGTAVQNMTTHVWSLQIGSTKSASAFHAGSDFPLWTKVLTNGTRTCH